MTPMNHKTKDQPGSGIDLDKIEALARAAEQMFTGMHWYTRFQILDGISNDESAAFIGALDPDTVLELIAMARSASAVEPSAENVAPTVGAVAWAVLADTGFIRYWSYERAAPERSDTPVTLPTNDEVFAEVNRQRDAISNNRFVSPEAVRDVMHAVRSLAASKAPDAAAPDQFAENAQAWGDKPGAQEGGNA